MFTFYDSSERKREREQASYWLPSEDVILKDITITTYHNNWSTSVCVFLLDADLVMVIGKTERLHFTFTQAFAAQYFPFILDD